MTLLNEPPVAAAPAPAPKETTLGQKIVSVITTTDHKTIGRLYLGTSFFFFLVGGVMALVIRAELAQPGLSIVTLEQYNQLFTMHGSIMLLLFATALFVGFANFLMPLQIGSPDVAFPRLNMLGRHSCPNYDFATGVAACAPSDSVGRRFDGHEGTGEWPRAILFGGRRRPTRARKEHNRHQHSCNKPGDN